MPEIALRHEGLAGRIVLFGGSVRNGVELFIREACEEGV
jgi:hypothetical protein